jgi:FtsP/CotA-like multicopper oxidase with cupredoxin domain
MRQIAAAALVALSVVNVQAAAPGIAHRTGATSSSFNLTAAAGFISQPDGASIYSWGYGCTNGAENTFLPTMANANCPQMQVPAPTLIVTEGDTVTVTVTNSLPGAAGKTSMLFPGFNVAAAAASPQPASCMTATPVVQGLLALEAVNGCAVTYTFTATSAGTRGYYSGTQGDLQIEMGLYGAIIVLPATIPANCAPAAGTPTDQARNAHPETDFRLAKAAYNHPWACYDREYLFQFSEIDPGIHRQVEEQVLADQAKAPAQRCTQPNGCLTVETEPYHPAYFLVNGRSMPDIADPNYAVQYPRQPYNGNPHMHPGDLVLLRIVGTGRLQHPFHEHGNHVRVLARDGNLLLSKTDPTKLAGPLLFTTTTTPGQAMDGIFQWTGKNLNWDVYAHKEGDGSDCIADANGYYTANPSAPNYFEWCGDHKKPLESKPFGNVGSGGPVTLPDANILTNGAWYGGSPYLGPDATTRAVGSTPIPPSGTVANSPTDEAGFAFMWHSHNEREITTNNIFPGGMMMMMLVDPRVFVINEAN